MSQRMRRSQKIRTYCQSYQLGEAFEPEQLS
uniref:Uncharacterized protein n=1 Tax=Trichinella nativa TaxID=6335 RepID=A0A0V1KHY2_9BILA